MIGETWRSLPALRKSPTYWTDCLGVDNAGQLAPFTNTLLSSGTQSASNPTTNNHPGILRITSSTSANSGSRLMLNASMMLLQAGDYFECIFSLVTLTNTTIRLGFIDTTSQADCTDGAYFEIASTGVVSTKTANNSTRTTAAPTPTLNVGTWYRGEIEIQSATEARFRIYNSDTAAEVLPEQTITTNIPTTSGRNTGVGLIATNSGTSALDLIDVDWIGYENRNNVVGIVR